MLYTCKTESEYLLWCGMAEAGKLLQYPRSVRVSSFAFYLAF